MIATMMCAAMCLTGAEQELKAKLPDLVSRAKEHYQAIDRATRPMVDDPTGRLDENTGKVMKRTPHSWSPEKGGYVMRPVYGWTSGHFSGGLWYLHELTGDEALRESAVFWTEILEPVKNYSGNHDTGFMMYCSYGNGRRFVKDRGYDEILVQTAGSLAKRYDERLGLIRSWGKIDDTKEFLVIPDNMMNLELLEFAAKVKGGDRCFDAIARSHSDKSMANHFRDDGGCYHVLDYDLRPGFLGSVRNIKRGQGLSCRTAWGRGQSWGIYGFTMMYRETKDPRYLAFARKLADFAIDNPNMPADGVPCWDYGAPGEERDSSAASVMASALIELSTFLEGAAADRYRAFAVKQLLTLSTPEYFSTGDEIGHFLLKHGVGHKPGGSEVDVPLDYGDYYYLEGLVRFCRYAAGGPVVPEIP